MKNDLPRALGLIEGLLHIKKMEDFDKKGLIMVLEEVREMIKIELEKKNKNASLYIFMATSASPIY